MSITARGRLGLTSLLCALLCSLLVPVQAAVAGAQRVNISVDVNIEGRYVPSALTLVVPLKRHVLLGAAVKDLDAGDRAAADFVEALARGDMGFARTRWDGALEAPGAGAAPPGSDASADTPLSSYVSFMSAFRDVAVLGRVPSDDGELVLFRADSRGTPIVRAFRMKQSAGQWRFSGVNVGNRPADTFVMNSFGGIHDERQLLERIKRAGAVKVPGQMHRLSVNAQGVELLVRGQKPGGSIPTLDTNADIALRTLSARILLLGNEQSDELKRLMSSESFSRYEQWRSTMDAAALRGFAAAQTVARKVLFVMNLGSASIVFYASAGDVIAHGAGTVSYEYVATSANRVQVANVFLESVFDDFLRSNADLAKILSAP